MKILIVEDDHSEAEYLTSTLAKEFTGVEITVIRTESAFRKSLPDLIVTPPNVIVLDMLLRWSDFSEDVPAEVPTEHDYFRAGLRCQELLASNQRTADIPIIFYSVVERSDLPSFQLPKNAFYCSKSAESFDLVRKVRSSLAAQYHIPANNSHDNRNRVFISYSHRDKKFLDELLVHLKPLERAGRVSAWSDKQIDPGTKWFNEIKNALALTRVAVLLVTANFLASDFIHEHELGPLLKEAATGGVRVLWVLVRACSYKESALKDFQAVISLDKPLAEMKAERDDAWVKICEEIKRAANGK